MARTKAVLGAGARLSDYLSASLLARVYDDRSYLSVIYPGGTNSKKQRQASTDGITVRVIDYALPNAAGTPPRYRLLTTLLDEKTAPALELAALYH